MKTCKKCFIEKHVKQFYRSRGVCNACWSMYATAWRTINKDRAAATTAAWYRANKESYAATKAVWRRANKERNAATTAAWQKAHQARYIAKRAAWNLDNKERRAAVGTAWRKANTARCNSFTAEYRTLKLLAIPGWSNKNYIEDCYANAAFRTRRTGTQWHVDHIVPLHSKLVCGLHWEENLRVIPKTENMKKGNRVWPDMP